MKRIVFFFLLLTLFTVNLPAQEPPNAVAHGSEKVAAEAAHPGEPEGGPHHGPKFLGLPAWIWKFVNMVAFLAFLGWLIGGPIRRTLAERHGRIRNEAQEARERRSKAETLAAEIESRLRHLEDEIREIRDRAVTEGERQKQEMIAAAEAEAKKILQNARTEVDNQVRNARHELTEYAGQLASERAEQILREKITDADHKKLFEESVREVEGAQS